MTVHCAICERPLPDDPSDRYLIAGLLKPSSGVAKYVHKMCLSAAAYKVLGFTNDKIKQAFTNVKTRESHAEKACLLARRNLENANLAAVAAKKTLNLSVSLDAERKLIIATNEYRTAQSEYVTAIKEAGLGHECMQKYSDVCREAHEIAEARWSELEKYRKEELAGKNLSMVREQNALQGGETKGSCGECGKPVTVNHFRCHVGENYFHAACPKHT